MLIRSFHASQICKDKAEAEVWIAGLKALTSSGQGRSRRTRSDINDVIFIF